MTSQQAYTQPTRDVHAAHVPVADVVQVLGEGGVAASSDQDSAGRLGVLVQQSTEVAIATVPLERTLAFAEKVVPKRRRGKVRHRFRKKAHRFLAK